jgi:hypothetical protein
MMVRLFVITLCMLAGCEPRNVDPVTDLAEESAAAGATVYGALQGSDRITALSDITSDPESYRGQRVRTEGEVQRVCQKRGCWLELADPSGARAFVPMAGHSFTVPMDAVGQRALIEGTVRVRERSQAEVEHLKSDGASNVIPAVSIEATGVLLPHG